MSFICNAYCYAIHFGLDFRSYYVLLGMYYAIHSFMILYPEHPKNPVPTHVNHDFQSGLQDKKGFHSRPEAKPKTLRE